MVFILSKRDLVNSTCNKTIFVQNPAETQYHPYHLPLRSARFRINRIQNSSADRLLGAEWGCAYKPDDNRRVAASCNFLINEPAPVSSADRQKRGLNKNVALHQRAHKHADIFCVRLFRQKTCGGQMQVDRSSTPGYYGYGTATGLHLYLQVYGCYQIAYPFVPCGE